MYQEKPKNILEQGPASSRSTTIALRWQGGKKEASRQLFLEIEYLHPKRLKNLIILGIYNCVYFHCHRTLDVLKSSITWTTVCVLILPVRELGSVQDNDLMNKKQKPVNITLCFNSNTLGFH